MIEISKEEALLCMEALCEGRKNLRDHATDFIQRKVAARDEGNDEQAELERKSVLRCETRADEMNVLLDTLRGRVP